MENQCLSLGQNDKNCTSSGEDRQTVALKEKKKRDERMQLKSGSILHATSAGAVRMHGSGCWFGITKINDAVGPPWTPSLTSHGRQPLALQPIVFNAAHPSQRSQTKAILKYRTHVRSWRFLIYILKLSFTPFVLCAILGEDLSGKLSRGWDIEVHLTAPEQAQDSRSALTRPTARDLLSGMGAEAFM
jgi:hypothetical protein